MASDKSIKAGVIISYIVLVFNVVAGLLYTPWMISKIGKSDYALYVLVTSFLAYFTVDYGLWQAVNKLVTDAHVSADKKREAEVIGVASTIYLAIDMCVVVVLAMVYFYVDKIYGNLSPDELYLFKRLFLWASLFAVLSFPFLFLKGIYMAKEMFVSTKIFDLSKRVSVILLTVVLLYLDFGVTALLIAFGVVPLVIYIFECLYLYRNGVTLKLGYFDKSTARSIMSLSVWLFIIVLGELFVTNIAPSLLAAFSNTTQIAIFSIGLALYSYVYSFAGVVNGFFLPKVTRMKNSDDAGQITNVSVLVSSIQLFIVGLFVSGILVLGSDFITLWLDNSFHQSYYVVSILVIPCLVTFCQPIESTELFARNKIKCRALMMICTAVSSVALSIYLCPIYGAVGAAVAIAASTVIFMVVGMNIIYARVLHRSPVPFIRLLCRFSAGIIISIILFESITSVIGISAGWFYMLGKIMLYITIYAIVCITVSFNHSTKEKVLYPVIRRICGKR